MTTWIVDYFVGVLSSLSATLLDRGFRQLLIIGGPFGYRLHVRELRGKLKDMPFIYKDIEADLLNDVVEVEFETLESRSLMRARNIAGGRTTTTDRIKHRRKALFLGQAGVGKTTFFRQTILKMTENKTRAAFFFPTERLVPFYVPLKVIDNAAPSPILRYLLEANSIFKGPTGKARLASLAQQRRLFLLLDGYDEIPFPGINKRDRNYIFDELQLIMGFERATTDQTPEESAFYDRFKGCRIWLSSRKEFYEQYRLNSIHSTIETKTISDLVAVELTGIRNNRVTLAGRIFSKYKKRSSKYEDLLSEEYFIQDIDRSPEKDLVDLSSNPLFLTVMCYIYASKVLEAGNHNVVWSQNVCQLVLECIGLLIKDLDQSKSRGLPAAQRAALLRRRNSYSEEKWRFLKYFAAHSILNNKAVFSVEGLTENALEFFRNTADSPFSQEILRGLQSGESSVPNFVLQLVLSGVFVVVDRRDDLVSYDFPHRRFRDALALEYLEEHPAKLQNLFATLDRQAFLEFLPFCFGNSHFKADILLALFKKMEMSSEDDSLGVVLLRCLENTTQDFDPSPTLNDCLLYAIRNNIKLNLPPEVFVFIVPQWALLGAAANCLNENLSGTNIQTNALKLSAELLNKFDNSVLREAVAKKCLIVVQNSQLHTLIKYVALANKSGFVTACLSYLSDANRKLAFQEVAEIIVALHDCDLDAFHYATKGPISTELYEVCGAIVQEVREQQSNSSNPREPWSGEYFYVVTENCISKAKSSSDAEKLSGLRGRIFYKRSEIPRLSGEAKELIEVDGKFPTYLWKTVKGKLLAR